MNLDLQDRLNELYQAYEGLCNLSGEADPAHASDVASVLAILNLHFLTIVKAHAKGR